MNIQHDGTAQSVLSIHSDCSIFCLIISPLVPLRPLVGLRPKFLHSLTPPNYACCISLSVLSQTQLHEGILSSCGCSYSDTHYLNRHMAWCGCHEILIQLCITVLFLSSFSLYPIQLWFCWLSYPNHSFPLISIQYKAHHSDSARNYQSCYQESFSSAFNRRQAHTQRHIYCWHSNKVHAFIASTVYKTHSLVKAKALAVPERSQKCLPKTSSYRRHETMAVTSTDIL